MVRTFETRLKTFEVVEVDYGVPDFGDATVGALHEVSGEILADTGEESIAGQEPGVDSRRGDENGGEDGDGSSDDGGAGNDGSVIPAGGACSSDGSKRKRGGGGFRKRMNRVKGFNQHFGVASRGKQVVAQAVSSMPGHTAFLTFAIKYGGITAAAAPVTVQSASRDFSNST